MISFDFDYFKPDSIEEAVRVFKDLQSQGKNPLYYAGGTEIISQARINRLSFDAAIDIKGIPECNTLELQNDILVMGAAITLTQISESRLFPLLGAASRRAADHTARDKITLGGNICGTTPYKESVLAFLLSDSQVVIAGDNGTRTLPIAQAFHEKLQLKRGEFLVQVITNSLYASMPYTCIKKTKQEKVDYPLVTVAALKKDNHIRMAFSGLCPYPFRSSAMEDALNEPAAVPESRIGNAMSRLPAPIVSDMLGSAEYRDFVLRNTLASALERLGGK